MVRQSKYKDQSFFDDYIKYLDAFKEKALARLSEGVDGVHERRLLGDIQNDGFMSLIASYTAGNFIEGLKMRFSTLLVDLEKYLAVEADLIPDGTLEQYIECIQILSFSYFFNASKDRVQLIADHISLTGKDMLIDRLIAASIPGHPIAVGQLAFPEVYKPLSEALASDQTTEERTEKIQLFLKNYYPLLKKYQVTWHDSHKEQDPEYCYHSGYWIFELGALAADIGWDDTAYRDHEMYPKDLVDWKFAQRPDYRKSKI